jgi:hypothetical protein
MTWSDLILSSVTKFHVGEGQLVYYGEDPTNYVINDQDISVVVAQRDMIISNGVYKTCKYMQEE